MKLCNKKTGEIQNVWTYYEEDKDLNIKYITDHGVVTLEYDSLAELNEEWEDYKPAEPLIKDEKIRKAVRAWAEANLIKNVMFEYVEGVGSYFSDCGCQIRFYEDLHLTDNHKYALAELCGEEE